MSTVRDRTAVITGSATGIGERIARRLSRDHRVVVNARAGVRAGEEVARSITADGGEAIFVAADVATAEGCEHLLERATAAFGTVTTLVNNAGATRPRTFGEWDTAHWHDMLDTNLVSAALCAQAFAAQLGERHGAIVNIASARALEGRSRIGVAAYAAAKAGVVSLTGALAQELGPRVSVNTVSPGFVATRYFDRPHASEQERATLDRWRRSMPLERFLDPDEIAAAVQFLVDSTGVTGTNMVVDGGWTVGGD